MRCSILVFLLLGSGAWLALRHQRQQNRLHQQLAQLTTVLAIENARVANEGQNIIKGIEAAVAKNRNQPADVALLQCAEALQESVAKLTTALRSYGGQLHHTTSSSVQRMLQLGAAAPWQTSEKGTLRQQALRKQAAAYADTLRQLGLVQAATAPLVAPSFDENIPAAEALADLSQFESKVLACQMLALQHIADLVSTQHWLTRPLITATAKSNVVAPGATYRAQLGLTRYFSATQLKMAMTCNGRPVPASPAGTGLVRFRAPAHPGLTTWTGTIRLNQNGRDTTFKVIVPYRVRR